MSELKIKIESFIEHISIFGIIGGIILGIQWGYGYFLVSVLSLFLFLFVSKKKKERLIRFYGEKLKKQWGKEHKEKRDIQHIRELYDFIKGKKDTCFFIDDITWRDLNMDSVFCKIDHTKSLPGMNYLYNILRNPLFDEDRLKERSNTINALLDRKDISQKIQIPLCLLGKDKEENMFTYFENGIHVDTKYLILYQILSYLSYLSIALLFIDRQLGFLALFVILIINAGVYQKNKYRIYEEIEIFKTIGNLIGTTESIVQVDTAGIDLEQANMKEVLKRTKKIHKNVSTLNTSSDGTTEIQLLMDYINMVTLRETVIFYKTINLINEHKEDIFELYNHIGRIDAYISIASYKAGLSFYTEPKFVEDNSRFYLEAEELYHPLLDEPVPYSFQLNDKGALVTGSNASGKSTYLRTIGINTLFSQTLHLVLAKRYCANYFRLLTSIGTTDSIVEGDSYFMAEAKSLKRIIDILDYDKPVLCILDEIFRGTNTAERISAASEVLDYMIDRNCCVIAATHDLELTSIVDDRFINCHFKETIDGNDIKFDYILREGPCTSRNAIAILKYLGYPREIHENANNRVEEYERINI